MSPHPPCPFAKVPVEEPKKSSKAGKVNPDFGGTGYAVLTGAMVKKIKKNPSKKRGVDEHGKTTKLCFTFVPRSDTNPVHLQAPRTPSVTSLTRRTAKSAMPRRLACWHRGR